ncbi:MAG: class E sortase [Gracilibacteraceae bacterium]|jgi:sortase A|nr:class E sortase [Gracilibacteraceae bacterium]
MKTYRRKLVWALAAAALLLSGALIWFGLRSPAPAPLPFPEDNPPLALPEAEDPRRLATDIILPIGELLTTREREAYEEGDLRLVLPRLGLDTPVLNGTELTTLARAPGLYEYGQLPDMYNTNTSIAAHRDIYGRELYYAETVTTGDFIYLIHRNKVFCYEYLSTEVVNPTNWNPIRTKGDCRVTLTTCEPRGASTQRLIIVGTLTAVEDYSEDYEFR